MKVSQRRLATLVRQDKAIAKEAHSATLALMEHRWNAVQEVGSSAEYARAVGVHKSVIARYVKAWEMWSATPHTASSRTPVEILELAKMGEQKRAAVEAVAEAKGVGVAAVRQRHMSDVRQVQQSMREEPDLEKSIAKGKRVAHSIQTVREAAAKGRAERKRTTPAAYLDLENHVSRANRALTEALGIARAEHLDNEYARLVVAALDKTRAIIDLLGIALAGETVDWDAELLKLEADQ